MAKESLPESNKKLTGHSARKGAIQKQKDAGIQETEIVQRTGHKNINSHLSYSRTSLEQQKKNTSVMLPDTNSNSVLNSNSISYNSHSTNEITGFNNTCSSSQNAIYNGNFDFKNLNPAMSGLFTNATINGEHFNFSFNTYTGTNHNQQSSGIKRK